MGKRTVVLATVCAMLIVVVFFQFYISKTGVEENPAATPVGLSTFVWPPKEMPKFNFSDMVFINGVPYISEPTPYRAIRLYYYTLLNSDSDSQAYDQAVSTSGNWTVIKSPGIYDGMLWHAVRLYLLCPDEPVPETARWDGLLWGPMPLPDPYSEVLINGWLYSQKATNLTAFTMPQLNRTFWAETASEPLPPDAQVQF
jgi:hypothetical protein